MKGYRTVVRNSPGPLCDALSHFHQNPIGDLLPSGSKRREPMLVAPRREKQPVSVVSNAVHVKRLLVGEAEEEYVGQLRRDRLGFVEASPSTAPTSKAAPAAGGNEERPKGRRNRRNFASTHLAPPAVRRRG